MNGYSKMRLVNNKTRSMDFSDLLTFQPTQETNGKTSPKSPEHTPCEAPKAEAVVKNTNHDSHSKVAEEDEDANRRSTPVSAHVKLSRTCSVAPTSSHRFGLERKSSRRTTTGIQSAVKRVFSMRRSSSVSERYCRIYDQHVTLEPTFDDEDDGGTGEGTDNNAMKTRSMKNKKKNGILKACKRLLGF